MARPKTHSERMIILERIIGLVKEQGRITTNDVVAILACTEPRRRNICVSRWSEAASFVMAAAAFSETSVR